MCSTIKKIHRPCETFRRSLPIQNMFPTYNDASPPSLYFQRFPRAQFQKFRYFTHLVYLSAAVTSNNAELFHNTTNSQKKLRFAQIKTRLPHPHKSPTAHGILIECRRRVNGRRNVLDPVQRAFAF